MNTSEKNLNASEQFSVSEVGYVLSVYGFLVRVSGLPNVQLREVVSFEGGGIGEVFTILEDYIEILIIDSLNSIAIGEKVIKTNTEISTKIHDKFEGLHVNSLGDLISFSGGLKPRVVGTRPIMTTPLSIFQRSNVVDAFETGVSIVDATVPLGVGQRELILGDRKTGKTQFLLQVLKKQAQNNVFCIYAAIGKRQTDILELLDFIESTKINKNVCVVSSESSGGIGKIFLTPYTAMSIAEYIRDQGRDVLLILDDLTTHAQFYREISLTAKRFPGRSAYPGNIFHIHSMLMERSGNFKINDKTAAITCLPVAQSTFGDIAGYVTTNLMSMTDGHIYLDTEIFDQGRRPAVNPFLSVTRVGHQTQSQLIKEISREVVSIMIEYREAQDFSHFGSEASTNVKAALAKGKLIYAIFDQPPGVVVPMTLTYFLLAHLLNGSFKNETPEGLKKILEKSVATFATDSAYKKKIEELLNNTHDLKSLLSIISESKHLN